MTNRTLLAFFFSQILQLSLYKITPVVIKNAIHLPTITAVTILIFLSRYYQFYSITCRLQQHLVQYTDGLSSTSSPIFRIFHQLPGSPQGHLSNKLTLHAGSWPFWFQPTQQSCTKRVITEGEIKERREKKRHTEAQWYASGHTTAEEQVVPASSALHNCLNDGQQGRKHGLWHSLHLPS